MSGCGLLLWEKERPMPELQTSFFAQIHHGEVKDGKATEDNTPAAIFASGFFTALEFFGGAAGVGDNTP